VRWLATAFKAAASCRTPKGFASDKKYPALIETPSFAKAMPGQRSLPGS